MPNRVLAVTANLVERVHCSKCAIENLGAHHASRSRRRKVPGEYCTLWRRAPAASPVGFAGRLFGVSHSVRLPPQCVPASGEALHACVCMSHNADDGAQQQQSYSELYAALARTATRSLALYFSRPVRLFRPSKGAQPSLAKAAHRNLPAYSFPVSGWQSLRGLADSQGQALSPSYLSWLVREHGVCTSRDLCPFHRVSSRSASGW